MLVDRLVALDAPDLLEARPAAQVKDFSLLDARELARVAGEQAAAAAARPRGARRLRRPRPVLWRARRPSLGAVAGPAGTAPRAGRTGGPGSSPGPGAGAVADGGGGAPEGADEELAQPGADDFRAVAPPVMSFAQGRRR